MRPSEKKRKKRSYYDDIDADEYDDEQAEDVRNWNKGGERFYKEWANQNENR